MSQIVTAQSGEGDSSSNSLSIKSWMKQNNMLMRDEIYSALNEEGIITIGDIKECTMEDIDEFIALANQREEFQGNKKIKLMEKRKLKKTYETLTAFDLNKKHFVDPEEINMFKSIDSKIKTFEDMLKNIESKEVVIKQQQEKVSNEIHHAFNIWIKTLNERKNALLQQLNAIIKAKNEKIKTKMNQYEEALDELNKIKTGTNSLLNKPLAIEQLAARKIQIAENETSVKKIIHEMKEKDVPIGTKIYVNFAVKPNETTTSLSKLGVVLDADVAILQDLQYDNEKADGFVKVLWKLPANDKEQRNLCVEYLRSDAKSPEDIQQAQDHIDDEKKWNSKQFDIKKDLNEGTSEIDVDSTGIYLFRLKYLFRNNTLSSPYSNIKSINVQQISISLDSKIISTIKEKKILSDWLFEHILKGNKQKKITLSLLYRMSKDGKDLKKAQSMYAHKGATLTLIQPKDCDNVCGGYASAAWDFASDKCAQPDENAFVFLLRSQAGHKPQIFKPKDNQKALNYYHLCGPSWGSGCVLRIYPIASYDAYSSTPDAVYDVPKDLLLGSDNCWLKDYEVYQVKQEN